MQQTEHDLSPRASAILKRALGCLRPHLFDGIDKVRVGKPNDGGYVMLDAFTGMGVAYSLGINNDVSWDIEIADRGIDIFQYDHTIDGLPESHKRFHWQKLGIGPKVDAASNIETLSNLIVRNGHCDRQDMILKCDIEGAEWAVIDALPQKTIMQFSQIVLETHGWEHFANPELSGVFLAVIEKLTAGHHLVHVHANNYAPVAVIGGIPLPDVLELTLARYDVGQATPSNEMFPGAIDQPCNPDAADLFLGRFVFE